MGCSVDNVAVVGVATKVNKKRVRNKTIDAPGVMQKGYARRRKGEGEEKKTSVVECLRMSNRPKAVSFCQREE